MSKELSVGATFDSMLQDMNRQLPHGRRYAVDTFWLNADPVAVLRTAASQYANSPSPDSMMLGLVFPRPADAPLMPDTAFSMVGPVYVGRSAAWYDTANDTESVKWLRVTSAVVRDETIGHSLGEVDLTADHSRSARSFAKPNRERLRSLRAKFDPNGVFRACLAPQG